MKKFLSVILILFVLCSAKQAVFAVNDGICEKNSLTLIEKIRIKKMIWDITRYSNQKNLDKIRKYYSKDFKSSDGFDYTEYFKMLDETFTTYSNIKYTVKIDDIIAQEDTVKISLQDETSALLKSSDNNFKYGILRGDCKYNLYLKMTKDRNWVIYKDYIEDENTYLTYGDANFVKMELIAPKNVKQGEEYTIGLQMYPWGKSFIIASLNNESIIHPPKAAEEIFRKLPADGLLERIVKSNSNGKNEYAMASIGFTKVKLNEDSLSISFKMSGLAFLLKRVNIANDEIAGAKGDN